MELDFDKEIDALLRKAAPGASPQAASGDHLDPDAISAFAAGSLPAPAKDAYTVHLAECDRCRKQLALTASFHEEIGAENVPSSAAAIPVSVPWYKRFFGVPALAYTMGALALLLSGFIGYSVLQRSNNSASPEVSQVYENEPQRGGPSFSQDQVPQAAANANSAGSSATAANTAASDRSTLSNATMTNTSTTGRDVGPSEPNRSADNEVATGAGAVPAAPPPAPLATPGQLPAMGRTMAEEKPRDEPKAEKEERAPTVTLDGVVAQTQNDQKKKTQAPPAALSAKRAAVPRKDEADKKLDSQPVMNSPATRVISGKRFEQKNGVWYDGDYRGQGTKKVRRGSEDYIRLDSGLRSIADSLGGTVIIVWNGKAYRIQ